MRYLLLMIFIITFSFAANLKRDSASQTVIDSTNKLMWIDDMSVNKVLRSHKKAEPYCEELSYAGYSNWRLPLIEEFELIVDKRNERNYINRTFKYNVPDGYWASKAHWRTFWYYADYMHFISGTAYFDSRHKFKYVRCVRDTK